MSPPLAAMHRGRAHPELFLLFRNGRTDRASWRTISRTLDVRAAGHIIVLGQVTPGLRPDHQAETDTTKCCGHSRRSSPRMTPPRLSWKVWTRTLLDGTYSNFHVSNIILFPLSHSGPNAGARHDTLVVPLDARKSVGVRVTSDCHSLVEPKVPIGSDGKPRLEQNKRHARTETALDGSLLCRSLPDLLRSPTLPAPQARMWPGVWTQLPVAGTDPPCLDPPRMQFGHIYCDDPRRVVYAVHHCRRVPFCVITMVAPALFHLTPYMSPRRRLAWTRCVSNPTSPLTSTTPAQDGPASIRLYQSSMRSCRLTRVFCGILLTGLLPITGGTATTMATYAELQPQTGLQIPHRNPVPGQGYSFARKRAYKRAVRRASQHPDQHTHYRGRSCTLRQLCKDYQGQAPRPTTRARLQVHALERSQDRILVLTWNAGGLSATLWQELLLTLENLRPEARPQVVCIQESHWGDEIAPSFITAQWTVYTSPSTDNKAAGLVLLVDRKSLPHGEVVTADPAPGRVQHVRLVTSSWTLDLLHVYQKPYNFHPKASQDARAVRAAIWTELEAQIRRIPKRHTLLILGDHNCPLKPCSATGTRIALTAVKCPRIKDVFNPLLRNSASPTSTPGARKHEEPTFMAKAPP